MNSAEKHIAAHYLVYRNDHPATTDLTGEHFTHPRIRQAWDKARNTTGIVDVLELLGDDLSLSLSNVITHTHEIPHHIDSLKSEWSRSKALQAVSQAADSLRTPTTQDEIQSILGRLNGLLTQAMAGGPHDSVPHSDLAYGVAQKFVTDLQTEDRAIGTPWEGMNNAIPGIPFGKVTLIGGRSSEHKTTLARLLLHYAVSHYGLTGLFWTGEDSAEDIARRCIASECPSLSVGKFSSGRWSKDRKRPVEDEMRRVMHEYDRHTKRDFWKRFRIEDRPFGTIDNVCAFIRQQHAKHGIRVFVGDFIQLIDGLHNKSDWVYAMSELCAIAKTLDLVMIWTSQVDKVGTKESTESNRPPRGIDMLFGTALRQQAYAVLMVGRDTGRLNVVVDKHKSAQPGQEIQLEIDAPHDRLGNYPEITR